MRSLALTSFVVLIAGACSERQPESSSGGARVVACRAPGVGVRLGPDSIGGIPMRASLGELRARCPRTAIDTVAPGGYQVLAVRLRLPGATLWAVSDSEPYTGHLDPKQVPAFWYASGDSLRFPDGQLIPTTIGALRASHPGALLRADNVDDTEGSYVVACDFPNVSLILGHLGVLDDTSASRLDARPLPDSLRFWRIRVDTIGSPPDPALADVCGRAPVT